MTIINSRNLVGIYEKALPVEMSWQQRIQAAKELGFDFLEISIDETENRRARLDWSKQQIRDMKLLCDDYAIPLQSMCLSAHRKFPFGSADPNIVAQAKTIMIKAIELAHQLGIRVIQLAGYDVYYEPANTATHQRFIEGMQFSAKLAEQAGVMLAVEIMDTNYLNSLSKFEILKKHIPSPYFMAYPDVGNINGWNYDTCTELQLAKEHIVQIHLKDTLKVKDNFKGQFRDLVIGEGEVNFVNIFKTLKQIDYQAPFVIEMWANDNNWQQNIITAINRLQTAAQSSDFQFMSSHS
ncbi:xylulose 5-phosphate 3-epimerase [Frischella perrara]|uniref:L-ribulose-5-phosphate 3-epimerase n=1 Tax=Frischella perrara TaxID=1267021 RepID=A0A318MRX9_FRIPE|nr:L-ribulose-5-phosphate 3-epimerase [Frischella perrara]PXY95291.1 xylulose 5-phosphate 3-epimerase [Frischella perrara]